MRIVLWFLKVNFNQIRIITITKEREKKKGGEEIGNYMEETFIL
jgi:hypothetical protein